MRRAVPAAAAAITVAASLIASAGAAVKTAHAPTAPRVAHVTKWGSTSFDCSPAADAVTMVNTASTQTCVLVTSANSASCVEKSNSPDVIQTCTITQTGTSNNAFVLQDISTGDSSTSGSTQTQKSTQIATVTQQGNDNQLDATQRVNQSLSGSIVFGTLTQNQDDQQNITVCQGASGNCTVANSGNNISKIHQARFASEHASGGTIVQNQDQLLPPDCDFFEPPSNPNLCALVTQNSSTSNSSDLHQENHLQEIATGTLGVNVMQKQNRPTDGIDGHAEQPVTTAQDSDNLHQHQTDDASAPPGATQSQDPELGCCSRGSNVNGHQVFILRASEALADQHGQDFGDCQSGGRCLLLAHGKINGSQATDRCSSQASGESLAFCTTFVGCDSGVGCTTTPPEFLDLASLGFDTLDFTSAINFVFPLSLPLSPL